MRNRLIKPSTVFFLCIISFEVLIYPHKVFCQPNPEATSTQASPEDTGVAGTKSEDKVTDYVNKETNYLEMGIADLREGNYEEAVEELRKVRSQSPDSSLAAYYLGVAYKK